MYAAGVSDEAISTSAAVLRLVQGETGSRGSTLLLQDMNESMDMEVGSSDGMIREECPCIDNGEDVNPSRTSSLVCAFLDLVAPWTVGNGAVSEDGNPSVESKCQSWWNVQRGLQLSLCRDAGHQTSVTGSSYGANRVPRDALYSNGLQSVSG